MVLVTVLYTQQKSVYHPGGILETPINTMTSLLGVVTVTRLNTPTPGNSDAWCGLMV